MQYLVLVILKHNRPKQKFNFGMIHIKTNLILLKYREVTDNAVEAFYLHRLLIFQCIKAYMQCSIKMHTNNIDNEACVHLRHFKAKYNL